MDPKLADLALTLYRSATSGLLSHIRLLCIARELVKTEIISPTQGLVLRHH